MSRKNYLYFLYLFPKDILLEAGGGLILEDWGLMTCNAPINVNPVGGGGGGSAGKGWGFDKF